MRYDDQELFYIQAQGFVGNSCIWWAQGGSGYTTNIDIAHKYTMAEVLQRFVGGRQEDKIWPVSDVDKVIKRHVDMQYLDCEYQC